jgi:hypothetical protein
MKNLTRKLTIRIAAAAIALALPATAQAQLFFTDPNFERGAVEPGDPVIGAELPGANPAEQRAALLWNLRAGLNVAALQCQFSRYLRSVDNYNAILDHHSEELASAYSTLEGYFRRNAANQRAGQRGFDNWNTGTYQTFSSLYGQIGFCQVASDVAKQALTRPKGELYSVARDRIREMRSALRPSGDRLFSEIAPLTALQPLPYTTFSGPTCAGLRGRDLRRCQQQQSR